MQARFRAHSIETRYRARYQTRESDFNAVSAKRKPHTQGAMTSEAMAVLMTSVVFTGSSDIPVVVTRLHDCLYIWTNQNMACHEGPQLSGFFPVHTVCHVMRSNNQVTVNTHIKVD